MMRALMPALLLLAAAAQASPEPKPTGSPAAPNYAPIGKDEQGLWAEADENERQLKQSPLLIREPAVNAYLRHVLCRTVGATACASVRVYLVRIPMFNADMSPNGMLRIYSGLLLRVRSEAELAAILGHEFTHFEDRHSLAELRKKRSSASWAAWLTVASVAAGQPRNYYPDFLAGYFAYSRDQEREADRGGLHLMNGAGYRPMAASSIWMHMREERDAQASALGVKSLKDADYGPFSSHPMDIERMTYLAREGQALEGHEDFDGVEDYRSAIAPIWSMLIDDQIKMNDFGGSEYVLENLANGNWTGPLLFARAELYRARGSGADLLTAEALYRQAIVRADAPAATWRGLGLVLLHNGRRQEAKTYLLAYLERNPNAPDRDLLKTAAEEE